MSHLKPFPGAGHGAFETPNERAAVSCSVGTAFSALAIFAALGASLYVAAFG